MLKHTFNAMGSISVSVPLLSKLGEDFNFNLKQGGTNYYTDAKTQIFRWCCLISTGGPILFARCLQVQMDPTIAAAYASQLQDYFANLQRYQTKQSLFDQAAQQQLHAALASG